MFLEKRSKESSLYPQTEATSNREEILPFALVGSRRKRETTMGSRGSFPLSIHSHGVQSQDNGFSSPISTLTHAIRFSCLGPDVSVARPLCQRGQSWIALVGNSELHSSHPFPGGRAQVEQSAFGGQVPQQSTRYPVQFNCYVNSLSLF